LTQPCATLHAVVDQDRRLSEDCGYCPQSARYDAGVENLGLLNLDDVLAAAKAAKAAGASRFCMGAAWRGPKQRDLDPVLDMVREVKALDWKPAPRWAC